MEICGHETHARVAMKRGAGEGSGSSSIARIRGADKMPIGTERQLLHPNSLPLQLVVTPPSKLFQPITGPSYQQVQKKLSLSGNTRHKSDN
jgi:hypothetical protein